MILPLGLQREVDSHLKVHLSQKQMSMRSLSADSLARSNSEGSTATDDGFYEQQEPVIQNSVAMERILQHRSLQMRNQQQDWQVFFFPLSFSMVILAGI